MQHSSKPAARCRAGAATSAVQCTGTRNAAGSRARRHARIALLSALLLVLQACLSHDGKTNPPLGTTSRVTIAILPLNVPAPSRSPLSGARQAGNSKQGQTPSSGPTRGLSVEEESRLRSLSIATAVEATDILNGVSGIETVPMWRTLAAASKVVGGSRWITQSIAADLANVLSVRWAMIGEISPGPGGYILVIDFIPAKPSFFAFRYRSGLRPEWLDQKLIEAVEQFLRYTRHPAPQLATRVRAVNQNDLFKLAGAVDMEYGWFAPPAPGKAQDAFTAVSNHDPRLAGLLFDPDLYAATSAPAPAEPLKPAAAGAIEPVVRHEPALQKTAPPVSVRESSKQAASPPKPAAAIPEQPAWVPLNVPAILALPPEQGLRQEQSRAAAARRPGARSPESPAGHGGISDIPALPRAPGARYVLQLYATANEAEARQVAQELTQAGVRARISAVKGGRGTLYRVSGGTYDSPDAASAAGDALVVLRMTDEYWIRMEAVPAANALRAPAAKPPQVPGSAGPAEGIFQVQVFASFDREKAVAVAEGLMASGLRARIEQLKVTGKGDCYRVRLSGYRTRGEAAAAAEELRAQGLIREYWVVG